MSQYGKNDMPAPGRAEQVLSETTGSFLAITTAACAQAAAYAAGWHVEQDISSREMWIRVRNARAVTPEQGWKIHVSATVTSAVEVLRRALPVLLGEDAAFKVTASVQYLALLNEGAGGLSQVGKFITVYPNDDAQAVRLAVALHEATHGLPGPAVPSDRPLRPGSLVHYRYGGFNSRLMQTSLGEVLPALTTPDGDLVPDRRLPAYLAPDWVTNPFIAAGVVAEPASQSGLVGGRYLLIATLQQSPRGAIHLAVDVRTPRRCVLKQAYRDAMTGLDGRDARDRLRHEAEVLTCLSPDPRFPSMFDLVEHAGDLFLTMDDIEGEMLAEYVGNLAKQGRFVSGEQTVVWGRELAALLAVVHSKGFVHRDLKSTNVIVAPDSRLRLLDFDVACEQGTDTPLYGLGTYGYMSPQQQIRQPASISDDIYALGALLYFIATGADPSLAPRERPLLGRPLELMNPGIGPGLVQVISRCLDPDPARRFPSMAALDTALAAIGARASVIAPPFGHEPAREAEERARHRYHALARRLGDSLCKAAQPVPNEQGVEWSSTHENSGGVRARDLNIGSAGVVLALAELSAACGQPEHRSVLAAGAQRLITAPHPEGAPLPGLYVGEVGIGAALLRAGQILGNPDLVAAAVERSRLVASLPYASPDLYNGTAGRLRFHLFLWDETQDPEQLRYAIEAGEWLLATAEDSGPGGYCWRIPPGYGGLSGGAYLSYAHGAAGIADALLDLYEATGEARFLSAAKGATRWLVRSAVPALDDRSGVDWPVTEGGALFGPYWCHGAAGIGRFFLHAAQLGVLPEAAELAARAARTVARGARWANSTQCHGLAGNIEFLLDVFQATCDTTYLAEARSLAQILEAFAGERDGMAVWPSEQPTIVTPDYMVGYAGVATCLLRLSDPERRPHLLSRRGFQCKSVPTLE